MAAISNLLSCETMKKFAVLWIAFLLCSTISESKAQGFASYLDKGVGGSIGVSSNDQGTYLGAGASYVISPIVEAGLYVGRSSLEDAAVDVTNIGPVVYVYPVRQSTDLPISVFLRGAYRISSYSGEDVEALEERGAEISGSGYSLSLGVFRAFEASPKVQIIPSLDVGYSRSKFEVSGSGESVTTHEDGTGLGLSGILLFQTSDTFYFSITPRISVSEGETTYGVGAAISFPQ